MAVAGIDDADYAGRRLVTEVEVETVNVDTAIKGMSDIVASAMAEALQRALSDPRSKKSAAEMRCRHESRGKRCRNRSRGPRFRYLCEEHSR